jgi:long-subunit fatty acid transport protein
MRTKITTIIIISLLAVSSLKAKNPGEVGGQWLKMGIDAASVARGGAVSALTDDASSVYWNEAGLADVEKNNINLTHLNRIGGIRYFNLSSAHPINKSNTVGINIFTLYTESPVRDRDTGNKTSEFLIYNSYFEILYGKKITDKLSVGGGLKGIYNQIGGYYKSGNVALDGGIIYKLTKKITGGLNIQNIPLDIKYT